MLKDDQLWAHDIIMWHLDQTLAGSNLPPLQMILHGEGGTGKSKVIQTITEYFASKGAKHLLLKAAYTGVAASLIEGKTTHAIAMLGQTGSRPPSNETKAKLQNFWQDYCYLIINKTSMIGKVFLVLLSCNIAIGKAWKGQLASNASFGGVNIIICGDFHQFPTVAGVTRDALYFLLDLECDSVEMQLGRAIYEEFTTVVILKEQIRCTDPVWHDFL